MFFRFLVMDIPSAINRIKILGPFGKVMRQFRRHAGCQWYVISTATFFQMQFKVCYVADFTKFIN